MLEKRIVMWICLTGILMLMVGCNARYADGPDISFFPVKERVVNTWRWAYAYEDGSNLTGILSDSTITFTETDTVKICGSDGGCRIGRWNLINKKKGLQIIFGQEATAYTINRLTLKEMWLATSDTLISWELVPAE